MGWIIGGLVGLVVGAVLGIGGYLLWLGNAIFRNW